ncbi:MAG: RimK family alpha-L-glutamate ligase [Burkholderiales bacterium]|nr:RimK family alpha-L-glutamate ligase [Burkholderiales bacterium]
MPQTIQRAGRIAIATDDPGWHGAQLRRAFKSRGYASAYVKLEDCRIDLQHGIQGIAMPSFDTRLPDAVFVRGIAAGTLEQVVLRLDILHALREIGIPVYNSGRAVERSVDKAMTSFLLKNAGIPTPPTWVSESAAQARSILLRETAAGRDVVIKPLFGSQGAGLQRLRAGSELPDLAEYNQVCYLQSFVETGLGQGGGGWHDYRVFVIGGVAVAAMIRRGSSWINNVALGGRCEKVVIDAIDEHMKRLAQDATRAVDMDYAGVDILRGADGQLFVIEVNSMPAWRGLQRVTEKNIAQALADDLIARHLSQPLEAVC